LDDVQAGMLARVIAYIYMDTVTVLDQFGSVLSPIYAGRNVWEGDASINQQLRADGTYLDPIGRTSVAIGALIANDNNAAIQAWESANPNPNDLLQDGTVILNDANFVSVAVSIAGHNVGMLRRRFTLTYRA
jgi:hypothetical protein